MTQSIDDLTRYICRVNPKNSMTVDALSESIWNGFIAPRIRAVFNETRTGGTMNIKQYVKIEPIEAVQIDGTKERAIAIQEWIHEGGGQARIVHPLVDATGKGIDIEVVDPRDYYSIEILTFEGIETALPNSWIAKGGGEGEFWPIRLDRFEATYREKTDA